MPSLPRRRRRRLFRASLTTLASRLSKVNAADALKSVDPQAEALAKITGFSPDTVRTGLALLIAGLIELGSGLGFWLLHARRSSQKEEAAKPDKRRRESIKKAEAPQFAATPAPEPEPETCIVKKWAGETVMRRKDGYILASDLRDAFEAWCQVNGLTPVNATTFGRRLTTLNFKRKKVGGSMRYEGVALRGEWPALKVISGARASIRHPIVVHLRPRIRQRDEEMKPLSSKEFLSESDRDLLGRKFHFAGDPEMIPGLIQRLPEDAKLDRIEHKYDVTPPGGAKKGKRARIRCAHCHSALHWKGWCVRLQDASLALIGIDCGEKQFALDFNSRTNDFEANYDRQTAIRRVIDIREALPSALLEVQKLLEAPAVKVFDEYQAQIQRLRHQCPHLMNVLSATLRDRGQLTALVVLRDKGAEEDRARWERPDLFRDHEAAINMNKGPGVVKANAGRIRKWMENQPPIFKKDLKSLGARVGGAHYGRAEQCALSGH